MIGCQYSQTGHYHQQIVCRDVFILAKILAQHKMSVNVCMRVRVCMCECVRACLITIQCDYIIKIVLHIFISV